MLQLPGSRLHTRVANKQIQYNHDYCQSQDFTCLPQQLKYEAVQTARINIGISDYLIENGDSGIARVIVFASHVY